MTTNDVCLNNEPASQPIRPVLQPPDGRPGFIGYAKVNKQRSIVNLALGIHAIILFSAAGCGSRGPEVAPVSGRVTFNGRPVTTGQIVFYPMEGRPAMGMIDANGDYRLTTFTPGDGAIVGRHRATIEATRAIGATPPTNREEEVRYAALDAAGPRPVEWLVPEEYSRLQTSPLKAEVTPGSNRVDFTLPPNNP